jgi:hypothetical protein
MANRLCVCVCVYIYICPGQAVIIIFVTGLLRKSGCMNWGGMGKVSDGIHNSSLVDFLLVSS